MPRNMKAVTLCCLLKACIGGIRRQQAPGKLDSGDSSDVMANREEENYDRMKRSDK